MNNNPFLALMKCLDWPKLKLLTGTTFQHSLASSELPENLKLFRFSSVLALGFALKLLFWHVALTTNRDLSKMNALAASLASYQIG